MSISVDDVRNIAKLACIGITESECSHMTDELNYVMNWINQLQTVDVSDIVLHNDAESLPERDDVVTEINRCDDLLKVAPEVSDQWFVVPKTIKS
ncbi:MAG: Asp-tRNA(Asn)/Glu-tRNA(Gln) amidotransferase subunit GatC [Holosporales bacterium]|jgi:aspartyl-tRNA(Asn)/glutamyl-tRNA(Gln) amidotransferase subunit C|nr:Asp-tRNA(Asn)/Glu-tRNA(Gln) amidotransferase subunit GatC [Holosporales bacterium]